MIKNDDKRHDLDDVVPEENEATAEKAPAASEVEKLQTEVVKAQENERRAIADYQNLLRRTHEDRAKMIKMAGRSVIEAMLQPLEHLYLAKEQLKDKGVEMVYQQFVRALQDEGVEEIECLGKDFDSTVMEVVDKQPVDDKKQVGEVIKIAKRGYRLNGEVIDHAKVVIGVDHG
jgi:molecular chaperone GrpE